jgi:cobalt/nickel transport system permease protein
MIREIFSEENSFLCRTDPRIRVVLATAYSFAVALLKQFSALGAALLIAVILIAVSRQNLRTVAKRLLAVNSLILFFWVLLPLTYQGEALFYIKSLPVSRAGIILSAQMTLKSNAILLVFIAMIAPMPFNTLGYALEQLHFPPKMVYLLLLSYRYIFVIEAEYHKLIRAAKMRGFSPKTNLHTYKTVAWLVGMLFVRASKRADRVYQAMVCRGFNGRFYLLHQSEISRIDRLCALFMGTALLAIIFLEWGCRWL